MRASARGITSPLIQIISFIIVVQASSLPLLSKTRRSSREAGWKPAPQYNRPLRMVSTETTPPASATPAWDDALLRNPHAVADKRTRVRQMFAAIAPSYDLNNRLHSLWMDQYWRRKAVRLSEFKPNDQVVDVACGTGDLALQFF